MSKETRHQRCCNSVLQRVPGRTRNVIDCALKFSPAPSHRVDTRLLKIAAKHITKSQRVSGWQRSKLQRANAIVDYDRPVLRLGSIYQQVGRADFRINRQTSVIDQAETN